MYLWMNTEETEIRILEIQDLPIRVSLLNDTDISRLLNTSEIFSLEGTTKWFRNRDLSTRADLALLYMGTVSGMAGITHIDKKAGVGELYIYLDKKLQGRGLGVTYMGLTLDYAFKTLGLNKVFLYTYKTNGRANHLYEKIGFVLEGILRQHSWHNGQVCDRCIWGILREEWL